MVRGAVLCLPGMAYWSGIVWLWRYISSPSCNVYIFVMGEATGVLVMDNGVLFCSTNGWMAEVWVYLTL